MVLQPPSINKTVWRSKMLFAPRGWSYRIHRWLAYSLLATYKDVIKRIECTKRYGWSRQATPMIRSAWKQPDYFKTVSIENLEKLKIEIVLDEGVYMKGLTPGLRKTTFDATMTLTNKPYKGTIIILVGQSLVHETTVYIRNGFHWLNYATRHRPWIFDLFCSVLYYTCTTLVGNTSAGLCTVDITFHWRAHARSE